MDFIEIGLMIGTGYLINRLLIDLFIKLTDYFQKKEFLINWKKLWIFSFFIIVINFIDIYVFIEKNIFQIGVLIGLVWTTLFGLIVLFAKFLFWISEFKDSRYKSITSITSKGFKLVKGSKSTQYYWKDFHSGNIDSNLSKLKLKGRTNITITTKFGNYYGFIKRIPNGLKDLEYQFIDTYFSDLKTCPVCGSIAVKNDKCLACSCVSWNTEIAKQYSTYNDYVKVNQSELFATMDRNEVFCDFKLKNTNFEIDNNWKPIVSRKEILEYSKKEFWDNE